jgi:hypothetical protein
MTPAIVLSALSGVVWGLVGYWLVRDTNMAGGAVVGLAASPAIGLLVGAMALRTRPAGIVQRGLLALAHLYVAVGLFAAAVGAWQVTAGRNDLPSPGFGGRGSAFVSVFAAALLGFTASGWVLWLWPASVVNHILIWRRSNAEPHENPISVRWVSGAE